MKIWANTIVHNEENFIWFAIMSVVDYVDQILVWDTGSNDKTVEIIKSLQTKFKKIKFRQIGSVDKSQFTKMRQAMLDQSDCDWLLILDGDEIWWNSSINKLMGEINKRGREIAGIVVPMVVPVGDIFHIQEEVAGRYQILGKKGHISLKAFSRKIPGLHIDWPYGKEGFFDGNNQLIQKRDKIIFLDAPFLHVTHLRRSSNKRKNNKFKYELGNIVSAEFKFPEIFYSQYPKIVPSPWGKMSKSENVWAGILTPLRKIKRRLSL